MADQERKEKHFPLLEVTRVRYGVWVDSHHRDIPQRDLMVVLLNMALVARFNLDGASSTTVEGGVAGNINRIPIELENFGSSYLNQRDIGLLDGFYVAGLYSSEPPHLKGLFDFYEELLEKIFEGEKGSEVLAGKYSTPEQTMNMINGVLAEAGGEDFPEQVRSRLLGLPLGQRAYLRGLTDEEINRVFVQPPIRKESESRLN